MVHLKEMFPESDLQLFVFSAISPDDNDES